MSSPYRQPARGIRKVSPIVTVAAAATPEVLYQLSQGGTNPRTVIVRKIFAYSDVGDCVVIIGTGLAAGFAGAIPTIVVLNGIDNSWTEDEIPEVEVQADITITSDVLGCLVQVEVEEIGP